MFHTLFQQLFTSLRGRESPITFVEKIIQTVPENRRDLNLQMQFEDYKRIKHLLVLKNEERIALHMVLQGESYEKMVNEIPHLFLISKIENSRSYLLKDFKEINPDHHKMGDIYVPSKSQKYEVKMYRKLGELKIWDIVSQYKKNDFLFNDVHFSISFQDILPDFSVEEFQRGLSDQLLIPMKNIRVYSTKEMREEVGDVKILLLRYYSIDFRDYLQEQRSTFIKTISDLSLQLKDEKKRKQTEELLKGLENPLSIKRKEIRRLVRNLIPIDHRVESSTLLNENDDLPPSSDLFDVD